MERRRLHMNSPMADSTRIDASSIGNRPMSNSFLMTLSPLRRNSVISSNGSRTPEESLTSQTLATATATSSSSISRQKLNLSQLDPRTLADVHSSGLTSRIAAYHENRLGGRGSGGGSAGLQRSMSVSNLYSPLSQPRRPAAPPLPYKSSVPVLSLTKIAPPERSFYSGNTLSSLMRSNSLVGVALKASDQEQLSRENRPILHPPHPQHECEPTRSVLEELKEISRKRINSGDTQSAHDFTKRSCQREDFVDLHQHQHHNHQHLHELHRLQQHQQHQSFKRQRELTVAVPLRNNLTSLPAPPPTLQHMYSNGAISPRQSPEQVAKRRNCSYSNDIASSLSSSQRHSNKRKLFDMRESLQRSHNESAVSTSSPETSPKSKVQRKVDTDSIGRTQSMPIPAVPAVPPARTISAPPAKSHSSDYRPAEAVAPPAAEKPKLTLFNARQPSQPTVDRPRQDLNSPDVDAGEYAGIQFVKPKQQNSMLGVRNPSVERTQKTKLAIMLSGLKGELYQGEPDEPDATLLPPPAGLPTPIKPINSSVVAPKTTTTTITVTTTITTTTTVTSTTSIFTAAQTITTPSKPVILSNQVIVPAAPTTSTTTTTVPKLVFGQAKEGASAETGAAPAPATSSAPVATPAVSAVPVSTAAPASASVTTDKAPEAAQPKFNLPETPLAASITSAQPLINFGSPKTTAPTLSFGSTTSTSSSGSSSTTAPVFSFGQSPASTNGPTVGSATSFKTETTKTTTSTSTVNSLGKTSTTSLTFGTSTATTSTLPRIAPTLTFGQPIAATTTATTSPFGTATTATSSMISPPKTASIFAFGQSSSTANGSATPAEPPAVFSFGGSTTQATNGAAESKPVGGTTFGDVFNSKPEASKPAVIFGSQDNTFGSPFKPPASAAASSGATTFTEPGNAFAFKTPTTNTATAAPNLFTFGGAAAAKPVESATSLPFGQNAGAAAATPFSFGGAASAAKETSSNTDVNKSVFAFGGGGDKPSNSKPSAVLNFGGGDKAAPPPAFGSVAPTAATVTPAPGPTSNAFSFGSSTKPSTPMFGSSGATATPAATKPFAFGAAQPTPTPTAAPAPTGGFSFAAASAKKTEEPSAVNLFGSPAPKPSFNFGGNTSNQAAGASPAAASGGFSFSKKDEPAPSNIFGSPASANTGVVKPTFGFGGGSNATTQPAPATSSGFGGFGAPAAAPAAAGTTNQNKPFAFGGSPAAAAPTAVPNMGGNLFASAVAATQNQAKPGGFAFGGAKNATSNSTAGNAPFSFGGAAAGGIASPPSNQSMNTAKPFSFGGAGGNPAPNVFGSPAPTPAASNPAGAFNFAGAASPAQQANAGNMFAPPPDRVIRKATRRLQK